MKKIWISLTLLAILVAGCRKTESVATLDDYSKLEKATDSTLVYAAVANPLDGYKSFIVEPVRFDEANCGQPPNNVDFAMAYLEISSRKAVLQHYDLAEEPAKNTAILRISLTSINSDSAIMSNPQAESISGAAIEIEIIDSITNEVLLSMVEAGAEKPVSLARLARWTIAKRTVDHWVETLANVLQQSVEVKKFASAIPVKSSTAVELEAIKPQRPVNQTIIAQISE